jgi:hypothetical protein
MIATKIPESLLSIAFAAPPMRSPHESPKVKTFRKSGAQPKDEQRT